ncbi:acylase [Halieaceae bacterium IMCC14734]|uniref:Acylase n=1 Tax=Candidatus Litorirhabdus singularis TaxID=2518993 RepID=A0ABT3TDS4_9GAMM|nr:acylase [Candidatus Litorirhabdus singularis]MCX2980436.1 acylase [Candidatus Litorirhabdus singularis]
MRFLWVLGTVIAVSLSACGTEPDLAAYAHLDQHYSVYIERDVRGVPHVLGERDTDVAFGFAYAQAEDNWELIEDSVLLYRGQRAAHVGSDAAVVDYLVAWLGIWDDIDRGYDSQLTAETRAYLEAFADGINFYAAKNPQQVNADIYPVTGKDIVAGNVLRHLLFYGFDAVVRELNGPERVRGVSSFAAPVAGVFRDGLPVGSNAFAISPLRSSDGATRLAINSHQPTTGPVAWYEAHLKSEEGTNVMGGLFPGSPSISVGFTATTGWAATVNKPDLTDVFVLDIDPEDSMRYRLDGKWHQLEVTDVAIRVKLWGPLFWTVHRPALRSVHGPVLQTEHGSYGLRYAGRGEIRQAEQWLQMNKARNLAEWRDAMRWHRFASFNFVFADSGGNIMFVHNSMTPRRVAGYDWRQYLPGDDSSLLWDKYLAFDDLPQVINPASGFVLSANQSPFQVSAPADNPRAENYQPEDGFPTRMTNRAVRGLELFAALPKLSAEDFSAIKHDKVYSRNSRAGKFIGAVLELAPGLEPPYEQARQLLAEWDYSADEDNRGAALGTCIIGAEWLAEQGGEPAPEPRAELIRCTDALLVATGRIDPRWGDINRHVRGAQSWPLGGGPDTLRAVYGRGLEQDGYHTNVAGDGLYYLVSWDSKGRQQVRGVHQYGSATLDENSPHYADQAADYANEVLHDPLFDDELRESQGVRRYRPGD